MHSFFNPLIQQITKDRKKPRERHPEPWLIPTSERRGEELPECPSSCPGRQSRRYLPGLRAGRCLLPPAPGTAPGWRSGAGPSPKPRARAGTGAVPGTLLGSVPGRRGRCRPSRARDSSALATGCPVLICGRQLRDIIRLTKEPC